MTEAPTPSTAPEVLAFFNNPRPSREERKALGEQVRRDRPLEALAQVPAPTGDRTRWNCWPRRRLRACRASSGCGTSA